MTKISDYAFLSDCQSAALVSREGSIDWYCVPRFDSPSVFGRLLDPKVGHWFLRPRGEFTVERHYVDETMVLRNVYTTESGIVQVAEALALEPSFLGQDIGREAPHILLRLVSGVEGSVEMEMEFIPRFEYGLTHPHFRETDGGFVIVGGPVELELATPVAIERSHCDIDTADCDARTFFSVTAGEKVGFSLTYRSGFREERLSPPEVEGAIGSTIEAWEAWSQAHESYDGIYADAVKRSALVLQAMTFQPSGSLVAAATTSIPEVPGGSDNWDYRYTWLRDASMTIRALWVASHPDQPLRFFDWISRSSGRVGREAVQIMYGVEGERDLTEHSLDHLTGYAGSKPVRVGNDAWKQKQLDVLGEVLNAAYIMRDRLGDLDDWVRELLTIFAERAAFGWKEPDSGIWETRGENRHYTFSKVMCWVALDRAVKLAAQLDASERQIEAWQKACEEVRAAILEQAWSEKLGAYAGIFGSDRLDAALLQMPLVGFLPATDERMLSTIDAIDEHLGNAGLIRRLPEETNGFIICSYWMAECQALAGRIDRAKEIFEYVGSLANDLGLLSEMVDPESRALLGNFPQAFSHVGLINTAGRLNELLATT